MLINQGGCPNATTSVTKQPPWLIYINRGSWLRATASVIGLTEEFVTTQPPQAINQGSFLIVPASVKPTHVQLVHQAKPCLDLLHLAT
jgi:hypothetical protein